MIKLKNTTLIITALLALNVSHNANSEPEKSTPVPAAETTPASTTSPAPADANPNYWGIETKNIAKDIQPGDDFYRYVNKGWLDTAKIPQGMASVCRSPI
jgi:endothelin-converting enzyme/putative endopeptidase